METNLVVFIEGNLVILFSSVVILVAIYFYFLFQKRVKKKTNKRYKAKYPSKYIALDGDACRSLSELIVDNCLYRNGIQHTPEKIIKKSSKKKYKYDWYLPVVDVYIEFFGYSGKNYFKRKGEKKRFYKRNHLKMIALEPIDLIHIDESLKNKLGKNWQKVVNSKHCPRCGKNLDNRF